MLAFRDEWMDGWEKPCGEEESRLPRRLALIS